MPRVGLEPTTYRFLVGILCHWDTEACSAPLRNSCRESATTTRRRRDGRRGTRTPRTRRQLVYSQRRDRLRAIRPYRSPQSASSTLGGTRTHNTPRLKRFPLPLGHQGKRMLATWRRARSGWRGTRTPKTRRQLVYSQRRYRLRAIHPFQAASPSRTGDQYPGWGSNPQRTDP